MEWLDFSCFCILYRNGRTEAHPQTMALVIPINSPLPIFSLDRGFGVELVLILTAGNISWRVCACRLGKIPEGCFRTHLQRRRKIVRGHSFVSKWSAQELSWLTRRSQECLKDGIFLRPWDVLRWHDGNTDYVSLSHILDVTNREILDDIFQLLQLLDQLLSLLVTCGIGKQKLET